MAQSSISNALMAAKDFKLALSFAPSDPQVTQVLNLDKEESGGAAVEVDT